MWAIGEPARRRVHAKRALRRATHRRNAKHRGLTLALTPVHTVPFLFTGSTP